MKICEYAEKLEPDEIILCIKKGECNKKYVIDSFDIEMIICRDPFLEKEKTGAQAKASLASVLLGLIYSIASTASYNL